MNESMTPAAPAKPAEAGFKLHRVFTLRADYSALEAESLPEGAPTERQISFLWDWAFHGGEENRFAVSIGVDLHGNRSAPDRLNLSIVGEFEAYGDVRSVSLLQFVRLHGVAILYPYLRERVTRFTQDGVAGPFFLTATNVQTLSRGLDMAASTGMSALRDDGTLRERWGISEAALAELGVVVPVGEEERDD